MRPIYEKDIDRQHQRLVIKKVCDDYGYTCYETKELCTVDYILYKDGVPKALAEIKWRNNTSYKYPTFYISKAKRDEALAKAEEQKLHLWCFVHFTDGIFWFDFGKEPDFYQYGGRTDRSDIKDMEILCHYKIARLRKI